MFKRILYDDWTTIVPVIAFIVTFTVFVVAIVRSIRMKKSTREKMSNLPLEDDETDSR